MQHFSSRGPWAGFWAQLRPKTGQKPRKTKISHPPYWPLSAPLKEPLQWPETGVADLPRFGIARDPGSLRTRGRTYCVAALWRGRPAIGAAQPIKTLLKPIKTLLKPY